MAPVQAGRSAAGAHRIAAGRRWSGPIAAVLAASLLRAWPLLDNGLHPDEALYASFARLIASGRDPLLAGVLVDKPPLAFYLSGLSMVALGPSELAARLPNYFAGVVSIALVFLLGRRLYGTGAAHLAAWLLALSPFAILFSITLFIDPLLTALVLWMLWAAATGRWRTLAVAMALALAAKQTAVLFAPLALALSLHGLPAAAAPAAGARRLAAAAGALALGGVIAATAVFAWDAARQHAIGFWAQGYADNMPGRFVRAGEVLPRAVAWLGLLHYSTGVAALNLALALGLAILVADGLRRASWATFVDLALTGFIGAYLGAYWLLAFNVWDRYLLPIVPLLLLLLARVLLAGGVVAARRAAIARALPAAACMLLVVPALRAAGSAYPIGGDHGPYDGANQAADIIRGLPEGSVLYDHWLGWHWSYYLFDGPVYVAWFASPDGLADDLTAFGASSPRYVAVPAWESDAEIRAAAARAGYALVHLHTSPRRDGSDSILVYELRRLE
jgi:4-amino-4-deoxy-L-arabinose transferase-like glycosyltransferase